MLTFFKTHSETGHVILRIGLGATSFFLRGIGQLAGGPERYTELGGSMALIGITFAPMFWGFMACITEAAGGVFLMLGLWVRPTSALLIFTMWIAALQTFVGRGHIFGAQAHAFELSIAYAALLFLGAGKYSLDRKFKLGS